MVELNKYFIYSTCLTLYSDLHLILIIRTGDVTLSPIPSTDQASLLKAIDEGYATLNAKASISTNAVNKYIEFYKNSKVQGMCNTVIFV